MVRRPIIPKLVIRRPDVTVAPWHKGPREHADKIGWLKRHMPLQEDFCTYISYRLIEDNYFPGTEEINFGCGFCNQVQARKHWQIVCQEYCKIVFDLPDWRPDWQAEEFKSLLEADRRSRYNDIRFKKN